MSSWQSRIVRLTRPLPDRLAFPVFVRLTHPPDETNLGIQDFHQIKPFLTAPFSEEDWPGAENTEGWVYSARERSFHGRVWHGAIDWRASYRTSVHAAASGYAVSYRWISAPIRRRGKIVWVQGSPLRAGGGLTVQLAHPNGLFTRYCHLSDITAQMRWVFNEPTIIEEEDTGLVHFEPNGHLLTYDQLAQSENAIWIERGQLIGYVGCDNCQYLGWPELHFEVFARPVQENPPVPVDPSGAYLPAPRCLDPHYFSTQGPCLWNLDTRQRIAFAA